MDESVGSTAGFCWLRRTTKWTWAQRALAHLGLAQAHLCRQTRWYGAAGNDLFPAVGAPQRAQECGNAPTTVCAKKTRFLRYRQIALLGCGRYNRSSMSAPAPPLASDPGSGQLAAPAQQVRDAIDAFLSQPDFAPGTRTKYRQTLEVIEHGTDGTPISGALLAAVVAERWYGAAPATWNRHIATVRSFLAYVDKNDLLDVAGEFKLGRRTEAQDNTRSIPVAQLDRLWERRGIPLRERTLWRMLYETTARAEEVLSLNVEDLDIPNKRVRIRSKGGDTDWLFFESGSARLLPRLLAGRRRGPIFQASRRPTPARAPAAHDICPVTGRARLSYRRAEELLVQHTGWTLHQFRHSSLTHMAEDDVQLPLLMAKSRHKSLRTLQRYARPGADAVAALTASRDRSSRRPS